MTQNASVSSSPNSALLEADRRPANLITHRFGQPVLGVICALHAPLRTSEHTDLLCIYVPLLKGFMQSAGPSSWLLGRSQAHLTWQDEVPAVLRAQHLQQALLHPFDFLPPGQEAEDPTCNRARTRDVGIQASLPSWGHRNCLCCTDRTCPLFPLSLRNLQSRAQGCDAHCQLITKETAIILLNK